MTTKPKIFISFSSEDRQTAHTLYRDLRSAGAEVFQFEESATPGMAAWDEVLEKIEVSDVYILLASKSALKSRPVKEEIKFAYYQYVNEQRPTMLLPLMLEDDLRLPREIRANNRISFERYEIGLQRLLELLQLENPSQARPTPSGPTVRPSKTSEAGMRKDLESSLNRFKPPVTAGLGNALGGAFPGQSMYSTQLPSVEPEPAYVVLAKYAAVIGAVALIGAVAGWFAHAWVASLQLAEVSSFVRTGAERWTWLPGASKIAGLILITGIAFYIAELEMPVDTIDYLVVSVKGVGVALAVALLWTFLFSGVANASVSFVLLCVGVAAGTVLWYAVLDEV